MQLTVNENKFQLPPEGLFVATLSRIDDEGPTPDPFNPGKERHRVKLIWTINLPDGTTTDLWDWFSASLHTKARLYKAVKALIGKTPRAGGIVELDTLVGRSCRIQVEHYESKNGPRAKVATYLAASNSNIHGVAIDDDD